MATPCNMQATCDAFFSRGKCACDSCKRKEDPQDPPYDETEDEESEEEYEEEQEEESEESEADYYGNYGKHLYDVEVTIKQKREGTTTLQIAADSEAEAKARAEDILEDDTEEVCDDADFDVTDVESSVGEITESCEY